MELRRKNRVLASLSVLAVVLFVLALLCDYNVVSMTRGGLHHSGIVLDDSYALGEPTTERPVFGTFLLQWWYSGLGEARNDAFTQEQKSSEPQALSHATQMSFETMVTKELEQSATSHVLVSTDLDDYVSRVIFEDSQASLTAQERDSWKDFYGTLLSKFPASFTAPLKYFRIRAGTEGSRGLAGSNVMILRVGGIDKEEAASVAIHELGHVVDLGHLTGSSSRSSGFLDGSKIVAADDKSADFYRISWKNESTLRTSNKEDFVSGYAMSDPFEDFSETFVYYVLHGEHFKMLAQYNLSLAKKYAFMRDEVFAGEEFSGLTENMSFRYTTYRPWDATLQDYDYRAYTLADFRANEQLAGR